jgi:hypothetical protein
MENLKTFRAAVKHDRGTIYIRTVATDKETARKIICAAEDCPDRAITSIKELKPKPAYTVRN